MFTVKVLVKNNIKNFPDLNFDELDLSGYDLSSVNFTDSVLTNANFSNTNLLDANLSGVTLSDANLSDASLTNINFSGATLENIDLTGLDLSGSDFSNAALTGIDLSDADLSNATIDGVTLTNVIMTNTNTNNITDTLNILDTNYVVSNVHVQIGSDIITNEYYFTGYDISLNTDGTIMAVGAYKDSSMGTNRGSVRVYRNVSGAWEQIGDVFNGEDDGDQCGRSISLSSDGLTIAISSHLHGGTNTGKVRVYKNESDVWTLVNSPIYGNNNNKLGFATALSGDGTTVVASWDINNNGNDVNDPGRISVYKNTGVTWEQLDTHITGDSSQSLGNSVDINYDGTIIVCGGKAANNLNKGVIRVFKYDGLAWGQIGQTIYGKMSSEQAGWDVSISNDGTIIGFDAHLHEQNNASSPDYQKGHARVYEYDGTSSWNQVGDDIMGTNIGDFMGWRISLSDDGRTIACCSMPRAWSPPGILRTVRIFKNIEDVWTQVGADIERPYYEYDDTGNGYEMHAEVALSGDGTTVAYSASYDPGTAGITSYTIVKKSVAITTYG